MHNLCSGSQYTLGSKGAQVVIWQGKQEHPAPSLTTIIMGHHKHWSGSRLTACKDTTADYAYILILHFPCGFWHHYGAQTCPRIYSTHPTALPWPPALKGVVPNNDSMLPATHCSFFFFPIPRRPKTHRNPRLFLKKNNKKPLQPWPVWLSWLKHHPHTKGSQVSIPGQGTYIGCEFDPGLGTYWKQIDVSHSPFPSL